MATTKYKIAEQIQRILMGGTSASTRKVAQQELIIAVGQALGQAVKASFFQNKNDGISEISGTFIYTFKNLDIVLDEDLNQYTFTIPSSYIDLPHESGVQTLAFMPTVAGQKMGQPIIRVPNGYNTLMNGLAVQNMEGRDYFYVEGAKGVLPTVTGLVADKKLYMALVVSLEGIDEDEQINISPEIQKQVIDLVVAQYMLDKQQPNNDNSNALTT